MELKQGMGGYVDLMDSAFNRTILELKQGMGGYVDLMDSAFNRTILELKLVFKLFCNCKSASF